MQTKPTQAILITIISVFLLAAGYVIFFTPHLIGNRYYFLITSIKWVLAFAAFLFFLIRKEKSVKLIVIICAVLISVQVAVLPAVNIFSESLPAWPRGTLYQYTGSNSIAQSEVGLVMRYYLNGKTLYANKDYPRDSHNGFLMITDEYEFVQNDQYRMLSLEESKNLYNNYNKTFKTISVQQNPKLELSPFKIYLSTDTDAQSYVLLKDEAGDWYFLTQSVYEEAFGG